MSAEHVDGPRSSLAHGLWTARDTFPPGHFSRERIWINHNPSTSDTFTKPVGFLLANGASEEDVNLLFKGQEWVFPPSKLTGMYTMPYKELDEAMRRVLGPVYNCIDPSLYSIRRSGFNGHGENHHSQVVKAGLELLKNFSKEELNMYVIAARIHDLGSLFAREAHAAISPRVASRIFPNLRNDPDKWDIVRQAVRLHDEAVITQDIANYEKHHGGEKLTGWGLIGVMREIYSPVTLALFIADKGHIGRPRSSRKHIGDKSSRKMMDEDPHGVVNFFGQAGRVKVSKEVGVARWQIKYNPGTITPQDIEDYPYLFSEVRSGKGNGSTYKAYIPEVLRDVGKIHPYESWKAQFWSLYLNRTRLMVYATFALFPYLDTFILEMRDEVGKSDERHDIAPLNPEDVEDFIEKMRRKSLENLGNAKEAAV